MQECAIMTTGRSAHEKYKQGVTPSCKQQADCIMDKEEVIQMAVSAIARQSEDKAVRQAYQRRKDEIYFHKRELADKDATIEEQAKIIAELRSQLGQK